VSRCPDLLVASEVPPDPETSHGHPIWPADVVSRQIDMQQTGLSTVDRDSALSRQNLGAADVKAT